MAGRDGQAGSLLRDLGVGALRTAELAAVAAAVGLVLAVGLALLLQRPYGHVAALACGLIGVGMMLSGTFRHAPARPGSRRALRLEQLRREEAEATAADKAAQARRAAEERLPRSVVSGGGVLTGAGALVVLIGFLADALSGRGA